METFWLVAYVLVSLPLIVGGAFALRDDVRAFRSRGAAPLAAWGNVVAVAGLLFGLTASVASRAPHWAGLAGCGVCLALCAARRRNGGRLAGDAEPGEAAADVDEAGEYPPERNLAAMRAQLKRDQERFEAFARTATAARDTSLVRAATIRLARAWARWRYRRLERAIDRLEDEVSGALVECGQMLRGVRKARAEVTRVCEEDPTNEDAARHAAYLEAMEEKLQGRMAQMRRRLGMPR